MGYRHSGVKIYKTTEKKQKDRRSLSLSVVQMLTVCIVMIFWWNAVLEVFHMPFDRAWLRGGTAAAVLLLGAADRMAKGKAVPAVLAALAVCLWLGWGTIVELCSWMVQNYDTLLSAQPEGEPVFSCAAVLLTVPVLEILLIVQRTGRGKFPAGLILCAPFIAAACAGRFQTVPTSWLLILGAAAYFASAVPGAGRKVSAWRSVLPAVAVCSALAFLSFHAGKYLDTGRTDESGFYLRMRGTLTTEVVGGIRDLVRDLSGEADRERTAAHTDETDGPTEQQEVPAEQTETAEETPMDDLAQSISGETAFEDPMLSADSGAVDLGSLAYFAPDPETAGVIEVDGMPEDTVYVPESWGVVYSDNRWEMTDEWPDGHEGEELREECRVSPPGLQGVLMELCGEWEGQPMDTVSTEISRELAGRAVYDTHPGATPAGKDFVEYFLFENQRGFCVHFATAATLMYRYCGYPARYVTGYAVPPSAFRQNEAGGYEAQITGEMGHAWCQVYSAETGEWLDMEHTPPSPDDSSGQPPAASLDRADVIAGQGVPRTLAVILASLPGWSLPVLAAAALCVIIFFVQAALRTAGRERMFRKKAGGEGIRRMYGAIIKTAQIQGAGIGGAMDENVPEKLHAKYPELSEEEWKWAYGCVMENLFYYPGNEKQDWERMRKIYARFRKTALGQMNPGQRWIYRYVRCL